MWARELAVSAPGKVILHGEHAVVLGKVRARRAKLGVPKLAPAREGLSGTADPRSPPAGCPGRGSGPADVSPLAARR